MGDSLTENFLDKSSYEGDGKGYGQGNFEALRGSLERITEVWRNKQRAAKPTQRDIEVDTRAEWRKQLNEALESTTTHVFIVSLLLIDLLATAVDILKTIHNKTSDLESCTSFVERCLCMDHFERTESWEFVYWISISILAILALNIILLMVACGKDFFRHPGYLLDLVVVSTALGLEIFLDSDTVGLLIILTLWRIVRVAHGIFEVTDEAWEKEIKQFEQRLQDAEAQHDRDQEELRRKDQRIAELERLGQQQESYGNGGRQQEEYQENY